MQPEAHITGWQPRIAEMLASPTAPRETTTVPIFPPRCACAECETQYYSVTEQKFDRWHYQGQVNDDQAQKVLDVHVNTINTDRKYLLDTIQRHGDKILSRWRKKTQPKRAALLAGLDANMPQEKWIVPRLEYAMTTWMECREKYRNVYLLPYLDVDTLSKDPSILIGILHNRTTPHPSEWAQYDHFQMTLPWACGLINVVFNENCVVMHGTEYGKLVPWSENAVHRSDIIGFPRANLIFEGQAYLMGFLRKVVEALLQGIDSYESQSSIKWQGLLDTGLRKSGDTSYSSKYIFQPFSPPPVFDINDLASQAKARLNATGDHLWLLQTEPSYLRRYANLLGRMELAVRNKQNVLGSEIIGREITGDADSHWFWQAAVEEFNHAQVVYQQFKDSIQPGKPLPQKVDEALGALEVLLVNRAHSCAKGLQALIPQRPGFSHCYHFTQKIVDDKIQIQTSFKLTTFDAFKREPLLWCLMQLLGAPDEQKRFPIAMMLKFLDDHLAASPAKERAKLDEILYEKLSDYATVLEMLAAVRMHYPKCTNASIFDIKQREDRLAWRRYSAKTPEPFPPFTYSPTLQRFLATAIPNGLRDQKWLVDFDASHEALKRFWKSLWNLYIPYFQRMELHPKDIATALAPISAWKSAEYEAFLASKRQEILLDNAKLESKPQASNDLFLPLPCADHDTPRRMVVLAPKTKTKTKTRQREDPQMSREETSNTGGQQEQSIHAAIVVPKRALNTFRSMFPNGLEERQRITDWDTFVLSMEDAGFRAKGGGGSIVIFEETGGKGKIIFHRPHPVPKLDPVMMQSMGRRMNKWFGWVRETFVPR